MKNSTIRPAQTGTQNLGGLKISLNSTANYTPIENATVTISNTGNPDQVIEELRTDESGQTETIELPTPPVEYSLEPTDEQPYSEYNIRVSAEGYEDFLISGAQLFTNELALQEIRLRSLEVQTSRDIVVPPHTLFGSFPPKIAEAEIKDIDESGEIVLSRVVIPETIVVHAGPPSDATAPNYYVPYKDYIKNVASCEIYSTWPESTITANVLAIMSFTLNRVYTEWYRNKGFDFTITNSTAYDHFFVYGRNVFESISNVVDTIFTNYLSQSAKCAPADSDPVLRWPSGQLPRMDAAVGLRISGGSGILAN